MNNYLKYFAIGFGALSLAACSSMSGSKGAAGGPNADDVGAYTNTAGMGSEAGFLGKDPSQDPKHKLKVANQIYYFDFDRSEVHEIDAASIRVQANYLAAHPKARIRLEGNTDERGSREYNIALGERRAKGVMTMLVNDGARRDQIRVVSYGSEKPAATGHNDEAWSLNRRVELKYEAK